jgi:hypothetical protein
VTLPQGDEYRLSHKDIQVFARQLVAVTIEKSWQSGAFDFDIAKFGEKEQKRIHSELRRIIKQFNGINGSTLPPEKAGRPKRDTNIKESA